MNKCLLIAGLLFFGSCSEDHKEQPVPAKETIREDVLEWRRMKNSLDSLQPAMQAFVNQKKYNQQWALVAHLGIHSGLPRMVVWDLQKKEIADSGLVAHGSGKEGFAREAVFSNTPNSYCSSLGRYKIGARYKGNFGWSYKLHGLDSSNRSAFERFIVLHPFDCVPNQPIFPSYICNSLGCPMVSQNFMNRISNLVEHSSQPLLLWVIR